ncbi:MAG: hypothetical protein A2066_17795 [Bacteroidetes bacterium GWB2_41_8]|nr:MAG: hypothetical protein A2066_17795 [Bacteroidetes bacterium GWB2_41_8]
MVVGLHDNCHCFVNFRWFSVLLKLSNFCFDNWKNLNQYKILQIPDCVNSEVDEFKPILSINGEIQQKKSPLSRGF